MHTYPCPSARTRAFKFSTAAHRANKNNRLISLNTKHHLFANKVDKYFFFFCILLYA